MKPIPGYPNYRVDRSGFVWSLKSKQRLSPCLNSDDYHRVKLYNEDGPQWFFVHRLVAQAFKSNPAGKPEVNHLDWNKWNNHEDNLEWVTSSENKKHSRKKFYSGKRLTKEQAGTPF